MESDANKVHETVYVPSDNTMDGWLGMSGDELTGTQFEWTLDPQRASADLMEHEDLHNRMDKHTIGRHQAIERMGDVNPEDVDDDIEIDRIMTTSWFQSRLNCEIQQNLDRGEILYQAAQKVISSGQLPGVGTAPNMQQVGAQTFPTGGATPPGNGNPMAAMAGQLGQAGVPTPPGVPNMGPQPLTAGNVGLANNTPQGPSAAGGVVPQ